MLAPLQRDPLNPNDMMSLRHWTDPAGHPDLAAVDNETVVDCGWCRLIFGQTFSDILSFGTPAGRSSTPSGAGATNSAGVERLGRRGCRTLLAHSSPAFSRIDLSLAFWASPKGRIGERIGPALRPNSAIASFTALLPVPSAIAIRTPCSRDWNSRAASISPTTNDS